MAHDDTATLDDLDGLNRRVDELERQFKEAFPHGDYAGHCRYHEIQIEMLLARRRLIATVTEKTLSGLVWALMIGLGLTAWHWFKAEINK